MFCAQHSESLPAGTSTRLDSERRFGRPRQRAATTMMLGAVLLLGACGSQATSEAQGSAPATPSSPSAATSPAKRSSAIHVVYESVISGGDADGATMLVDQLVDGARFRTTVRDKSDPGRVLQVMVWDGQTMLFEEPGAGPPWREENPPADQRPFAPVLHPGDATFDRLCPKGHATGHVRVVGRAGTVYTCPAQVVEGEPLEKWRLTLDDATGLILRREGAGTNEIAIEVTVGVATSATTFSTDLPAGATTPGPLTNIESTPRVGGGTLLTADIRKGPSLVVIGDLKGLKAMLEAILPETGNGTRPHVYGLLSSVPAPEWKGSLANPEDEKRFVNEVSAAAGAFPVPVGIDIKGAVAGEELRPVDQAMAGTTVLAAINADGTLAWRMTDTELASSRQKLKDWIASTG
jgi:hypothetical protein